MKNRVLSTAFLLFTYIFCSSCNRTHESTAVAHEQNCLYVTKDSVIKENKGLKLTINAHYPKLNLTTSNCENKYVLGCKKVNEIIRKIIDGSIKEISNAALDNSKDGIDSSLNVDVTKISSTDSLFQVVLEYNEDGIGPSLAEQGKACFFLDTTKDEKVQYQQVVFTGLGHLLGDLHEVSYVCLQDVQAETWGCGGVTQEFGSMQAKR